ncbi:MAG: hypothetical protein RL708_693 [Bacteroidota bacterium]|jgi:hypothetical protein
MNNQFSNVVDAVYNLPLADRLELKNLLEHNIIEARRDEIANTLSEAKAEYGAKKMKFSNSITDLKKQLK